jgi:transcriptional regulator with XRE-family HTH domain
MPILTEHLPDILRRLRHERRLSQATLAARAGLRQQDVSLLERGLRPSRLVDLDRLARALGVDVLELLGLHAREGPAGRDGTAVEPVATGGRV